MFLVKYWPKHGTEMQFLNYINSSLYIIFLPQTQPGNCKPLLSNATKKLLHVFWVLMSTPFEATLLHGVMGVDIYQTCDICAWLILNQVSTSIPLAPSSPKDNWKPIASLVHHSPLALDTQFPLTENSSSKDNTSSQFRQINKRLKFVNSWGYIIFP